MHREVIVKIQIHLSAKKASKSIVVSAILDSCYPLSIQSSVNIRHPIKSVRKYWNEKLLKTDISGRPTCSANPAGGGGHQPLPAEGGEHHVRPGRPTQGRRHRQRSTFERGEGRVLEGGRGCPEGGLHLPHRPGGKQVQRWEDPAEAEEQEVLRVLLARQQTHPELVLQEVTELGFYTLHLPTKWCSGKTTFPEKP